jgi:repressor LexA
MTSLTQRQRDALDVIRQSLRERGIPPTLREIAVAMGIRSRSNHVVRDHLKALERKGYIALDTCRARGIKLMNEPGRPGFTGLKAGDVRVPVLGRITTERPVLQQPIVEIVTIHRRMLHNRTDVFGFRVTGNAMSHAGILHGDCVFVTPEVTIASGKIVLVTFGEEAFVRYYFPERTFVRFQPANNGMSATYVHREDFKPSMLLGQVIGVFRLVTPPPVATEPAQSEPEFPTTPESVAKEPPAASVNELEGEPPALAAQ